MKLYFYQFHGDQKPRLVADISHAHVQVSPEYINQSVVSIMFPDKRHWLIECEDRKLAARLEFAVDETQKAVLKKKSMYMRVDDVLKKVDYGFNMHVY